MRKKKSKWETSFYSYRKCSMEAGMSEPGMPPPQILTDQLTPFKPRGTDYAHHITNAPLPPPLDFQTFLRPWEELTKVICGSWFDAPLGLMI